MKYSIIIPAYNRLSHLKKCIEGIAKNTDLTDVEVIIVSNGCTDGTPEYIKSLGNPYKVIHWPEPLGYACAGNVGFNVAKGDYIIRMDSDSIILSPGWLDMLETPFTKFPTAGISGPQVCPGNSENSCYACDFAVFFCVMIKKEVFYKVGYLDPIFNKGGGEDTDFCARAVRAGYTIHNAQCVYTPDNIISFPLFHAPSIDRGEESQEKIEQKQVCAKILEQRYGKVRV